MFFQKPDRKKHRLRIPDEFFGLFPYSAVYGNLQDEEIMIIMLGNKLFLKFIKEIIFFYDQLFRKL